MTDKQNNNLRGNNYISGDFEGFKSNLPVNLNVEGNKDNINFHYNNAYQLGNSKIKLIKYFQFKR